MLCSKNSVCYAQNIYLKALNGKKKKKSNKKTPNIYILVVENTVKITYSKILVSHSSKVIEKDV